MNKEQLVTNISSETGLSKKDVAVVLDSYVHTVSDALSGNDEVQLIGFGRFFVKQTSARTGRNPRTGESINIPAKRVVKFSPAQKLKDSANDN